MTAEGAKEFVLAFYAEQDRVIQHNEEYERYLPAYMTPECECRLIFDFYRRTVLPGHLEGGLVQAISATTTSFTDTEAVVHVKSSGGEQRIYDAAGKLKTSSPPYDSAEDVHVEWRSGRWQIIAVDL